MKNAWTKYLMIALALCLVVCIAACGGNEGNGDTTTDAGNVETPTTDGNGGGEETTTEDPGSLPAADPVKDPAEKDIFRT
jgi:hypothetical protein